MCSIGSWSGCSGVCVCVCVREREREREREIEREREREREKHELRAQRRDGSHLLPVTQSQC